VRAKLPSIKLIVDSKDPIIHLYYGPKNLKPILAYTPFKDLNIEDFVLVKHHDLFVIPIWIGRTYNDVVKDDQK